MPNQFKNAKAVNVGASYVTVYTADPGVTATVIGASFANKLGSGITINARMRDNDDAGAFVALIGTDTPVDPGGALAPWGGDQKLVLEENDRIDVMCSDPNGLDVVISVLEQS
jgi:hypothetical protein